MKFYLRTFSGETDMREMAALAQAFPESHLHSTDLPYRLSSWGMDDPENIRLWSDSSGRLVGWAALQTPFWTIDYACHPDAEIELFPEILAWADFRAKEILETPFGLPTWFVNVFTGQSERIRALEEAGFANQAQVGEDSWTKVLMRRAPHEPVKPYRVTEGFLVRPLAGENEVEPYVELHQAVFETKNMTVEWRGRTLHHPVYSPDLDIVVATPDGQLAAFCIGWLARSPGRDPVGQIEPLGCHKDFRRYALGRVALAEVLRRMQAAGVGSIFVETDNYRNTALTLYESMGFHVIQDVLVFRKDYGT